MFRPVAGAWPEQAGANGRSIFDTFLFFFDPPASSWPEQILDMLFLKGMQPKNLNFFASCTICIFFVYYSSENTSKCLFTCTVKQFSCSHT